MHDIDIKFQQNLHSGENEDVTPQYCSKVEDNAI